MIHRDLAAELAHAERELEFRISDHSRRQREMDYWRARIEELTWLIAADGEEKESE